MLARELQQQHEGFEAHSLAVDTADVARELQLQFDDGAALQQRVHALGATLLACHEELEARAHDVAGRDSQLCTRVGIKTLRRCAPKKEKTRRRCTTHTHKSTRTAGAERDKSRRDT
jgi:hypothetical protein